MPVAKTLAKIDWGAIPDLNRAQIEQLAHDSGWLEQVENLLLCGPSGVGKTHLAAGLDHSLIALDRSGRFFSVMTLLQELQGAEADDAPAKALNKLDRYALLVIDDIGYVRQDEAETSVLFELVDQSTLIQIKGESYRRKRTRLLAVSEGVNGMLTEPKSGVAHPSVLAVGGDTFTPTPLTRPAY
ncbi:MAG: ATP-binding protein [Cyanobacteriota bacterium]|nr:ATP-binding protein [Cyanobacteriota bacterium]